MLSLVALLVLACKEEKTAPPKTLAYQEINNEQYRHTYGYWTGFRYDDYTQLEKDSLLQAEGGLQITLKINRIVEGKIYGFSIVGGSIKPVEGECSKANRVLLMHLREPGELKDSGKYELQLKNDTLSGTWVPYIKQEGRISVKKIEFVQKVFKYDPNYMLSDDVDLIDFGSSVKKDTVYDRDEGEGPHQVAETMELYRSASEDIFKINASTRTLAEDELKNLRKLDLEIIRNTVFARHGYSFKRSSLRSFFEAADWYVPVSNNVDKELTPLEKQNIALLKRLETYAEDHYDSFGR